MNPSTEVEIRFWKERETAAQKMASDALKAKVRASDREDFYLAGQYYLEEMEAERRIEQAARNIARLTAELSVEQTVLVLGGPF